MEKKNPIKKPTDFNEISEEELKKIEEEVDHLVASSDEIADSEIEVIADLFSYYSEVAQTENQMSVEWIKMKNLGS